MKKQLHFITIILMLAGTFAGWAQKEEKEQPFSFTVVDTINGEIRTARYESEKIYLELLERKNNRIKYLLLDKQRYESDQRTQLAKEIKDINERIGKLENYTVEMSKKDKEFTAELYAQKISAYDAMVDSEIAFVEINGSSFDNKRSGTTLKLFGTPGVTSVGSDKYRKNISTTSGLTLGFGYNFINGDNLAIDDFSYGKNEYFSIGVNWKTALNKSQTIRFKYGIEYQTQGTELNGNRAFTISDPNNTQIERLNFDFDKAKFRQDQLVFPVHFEFSGTDRKEYEDGRVRYNDYDKFKFGIGGYAGFNLSSRLKYKYELDGQDVKQTNVNAFDTNALVYGLDAYFGKGDLVLFGRMGLNDIFKSGSVDGQYVAFGIRFQ